MKLCLYFAPAALALACFAGPAAAFEPIRGAATGPRIVLVSHGSCCSDCACDPCECCVDSCCEDSCCEDSCCDDSCCEDSCCDDCCDDGCGGGCGCHIIGGVGFLYVQPHFERNPAAAIFTSVPGGTTVNTNSQLNFTSDYDFAPLGWVGVVTDDGLGVRSRFWEFEDAADPITLVNVQGAGANAFGIPALGPGAGTTIFSAYPLGQGNTTVISGAQVQYRSALELTVIDLEATQEIRRTRWTTTFGGGLRYARLEQDYTATERTAPFGGAITGSDLISHHQFEGFGPVLSAEARRSVLGPLGLYGLGRGALLFGGSTQRVDDFQFAAGATTIREVNAVRHDDVLPVIELEFGVEMGAEVGEAWVFLQTAVVGQAWMGAGNAANTADIALGPQAGNIGTVPDESADDSSNLGFFGLKFTAGMEFRRTAAAR